MYKKIKTEVAIGIIFFLALVTAILILVVSNDIEKSSGGMGNQTIKSPSASRNQLSGNRVLFASFGQTNIYKVQKDDNKWVVVVDGQESAAYDSVSAPAFNQDGTQFAFSGNLNGQSVAVVNNAPQAQTYSAIDQIIFSPDGKSLAVVAIRDNQSIVIIDGKESKKYQKIAPLTTPSGVVYAIFSPDGQKIAYKVVDDSGTYMVINGQEGKKYTDVSNFTFSADGTQFAYQAEINGQQITVVDNKEVVSQNNPASNTPANSSDNVSSNSSGRGNDPSEDAYFNDQKQPNFPICRKTKGCNF